jgi:hypothetical protein
MRCSNATLPEARHLLRIPAATLFLEATSVFVYRAFFTLEDGHYHSQ